MGASDRSGPGQVRALARHAALPLPAAREEAVAALLQAWIGDANALSAKMSAPEHWTIAPATVFSHPPSADEEG